MSFVVLTDYSLRNSSRLVHCANELPMESDVLSSVAGPAPRPSYFT